MPEFLEDPSVLTKDKLKSELVANNVTLPAGEQRKDVYVQLYLQHLTPRNRPPLAAGANSKGPPDFSSDEEREPTPVPGPGARGRAAAGRKATKKTDKPRIEDKDDLDVTELSNEDLLDQLVRYGVNPGPIVGTTRKLYEKKLLKLREQGTESRSSTPLPTISSSENTRQNGSNDSDRYSDNEEGKKKEHKKVKSTRDFVAFSELPTTPSGGFFQGISFPEISTRPPLGRTELQAAKKVHTPKGDPPREPLKTTTLPGKGQMQKLARGGSLFTSSKSSHDSCLERSPSSSSQHELTAMVSTAASPSVIKETTTTYCKDIVENIYHGGKSGIQPLCTEKANISDQSILSSEREILEECRRSQVLSPPLAQAIRDYVNSLLVQGGASSLPGTSNSVPTLDIEKICKRIDPSKFQETESLSPPRKLPRLSEKAVEERDPGLFVASQSSPGSAQMSASAKMVVSRALTTLGIEMSKQSQHDKTGASELSFPFHESILKAVEEEWQQIDRQLPSLACKYPVSSREATRILSVPKVDDEILGFISEATPPAGIQPASAESCDKHLDLALCRTYEAAASALQTATHTAFVAKAMQADISQAAQILSSDPSQVPQALEILRRTYDAASFLCEAAFDEVKMAGCTMASSTAGRRHLWLKDCKLSPASKSKLTAAPFKGGTLFGGEVHTTVKKRGNKQ
ncbi:PREDICTED: thymopoietin isoform X1 [Chinchilla lanigera]|uniref:thymopoietin isoform X1 n=1 Tax=Chinchilla lanigera TaxID=34839 RepID=UPI00069669CF|nr:PREDICTED: thymopoietin isoform X1 [Chinchilla lanigera]